ncbi:MAG: DUF177 domain-containing protein [Actinobacteria bacterium]|nr:DUF177 domain-containing protein [Actinomycetota bacterium]
MFRVPTADLLRHPGERRRIAVDGAVAEVATSGASVESDAHADLIVEAASSDALVVHGTVTATWSGECRRCLGPATGTVMAEVRELFERGSDGEETYPLAGDQIDVGPLVRDAVLLELPLAPLCREACAGLCPDCGANRNKVDCGHTPDTSDARWAALDQLGRAEGAQKTESP